MLSVKLPQNQALLRETPDGDLDIDDADTAMAARYRQRENPGAGALSYIEGLIEITRAIGCAVRAGLWSGVRTVSSK